jgi:hypothetical protein
MAKKLTKRQQETLEKAREIQKKSGDTCKVTGYIMDWRDALREASKITTSRAKLGYYGKEAQKAELAKGKGTTRKKKVDSPATPKVAAASVVPKQQPSSSKVIVKRGRKIVKTPAKPAPKTPPVETTPEVKNLLFAPQIVVKRGRKIYKTKGSTAQKPTLQSINLALSKTEAAIEKYNPRLPKQKQYTERKYQNFAKKQAVYYDEQLKLFYERKDPIGLLYENAHRYIKNISTQIGGWEDDILRGRDYNFPKVFFVAKFNFEWQRKYFYPNGMQEVKPTPAKMPTQSTAKLKPTAQSKQLDLIEKPKSKQDAYFEQLEKEQLEKKQAWKNTFQKIDFSEFEKIYKEIEKAAAPLLKNPTPDFAKYFKKRNFTIEELNSHQRYIINRINKGLYFQHYRETTTGQMNLGKHYGAVQAMKPFYGLGDKQTLRYKAQKTTRTAPKKAGFLAKIRRTSTPKPKLLFTKAQFEKTLATYRQKAPAIKLQLGIKNLGVEKEFLENLKLTKAKGEKAYFDYINATFNLAQKEINDQSLGFLIVAEQLEILQPILYPKPSRPSLKATAKTTTRTAAKTAGKLAKTARVAKPAAPKVKEASQPKLLFTKAQFEKTLATYQQRAPEIESTIGFSKNAKVKRGFLKNLEIIKEQQGKKGYFDYINELFQLAQKNIDDQSIGFLIIGEQLEILQPILYPPSLKAKAKTTARTTAKTAGRLAKKARVVKPVLPKALLDLAKMPSIPYDKLSDSVLLFSEKRVNFMLSETKKLADDNLTARWKPFFENAKTATISRFEGKKSPSDKIKEANYLLQLIKDNILQGLEKEPMASILTRFAQLEVINDLFYSTPKAQKAPNNPLRQYRFKATVNSRSIARGLINRYGGEYYANSLRGKRQDYNSDYFEATEKEIEAIKQSLKAQKATNIEFFYKND